MVGQTQRARSDISQLHNLGRLPIRFTSTSRVIETIRQLLRGKWCRPWAVAVVVQIGASANRCHSSSGTNSLALPSSLATLQLSNSSRILVSWVRMNCLCSQHHLRTHSAQANAPLLAPTVPGSQPSIDQLAHDLEYSFIDIPGELISLVCHAFASVRCTVRSSCGLFVHVALLPHAAP